MNATVRPLAPEPSAARLLIHATADLGVSCSNLLVGLQWWLSMRADGRRQQQREPLKLHIEDAHGARVFAIDDAGPLVDIALPAGTYQVTANLGEVRRGYTMTLPRGASVDLYLRLAPEQQ